MNKINKCPNCGSNLKLQGDKLICQNCDSTFNLSEIELKEATKTNLDGFIVYSCSSCGGEIFSHETNVISICPFCESYSIEKSTLKGDIDGIKAIPFETSTLKVKENIDKILHRVFRDYKFNYEIIQAQRIYLPVDAIDGVIKFTKDGNPEYGSFKNIVINKSTIINDNMLNIIASYDFTEESLKKTNLNTLIDYSIKKADKKEEERLNKEKEYLIKYSNENKKNNFSYKVTNRREILIPVWYVTLEIEGKNNTALVNGQNYISSFEYDVDIDKFKAKIKSETLFTIIFILYIGIPLIFYIFQQITMIIQEGNFDPKSLFGLISILIFIAISILLLPYVVDRIESNREKKKVKENKSYYTNTGKVEKIYKYNFKQITGEEYNNIEKEEINVLDKELFYHNRELK